MKYLIPIIFLGVLFSCKDKIEEEVSLPDQILSDSATNITLEFPHDSIVSEIDYTKTFNYFMPKDTFSSIEIDLDKDGENDFIIVYRRYYKSRSRTQIYNYLINIVIQSLREDCYIIGENFNIKF
jgi:hypothetical protein